MSFRRLILITGMTGSGKTTLAGLFKIQGYRVLTMGDVIRNMAKEKGLDPTPSNLGSLATKIRERGGDVAVARRCVQKLQKIKDNKGVVDGIRSIAEVNLFRNSFNVDLIAVHASPETRYSRLRVRKRTDDPIDREAFRKRDERELGFSLGWAISMADHMIVNEGTFKELEVAFKGLTDRLDEE